MSSGGGGDSCSGSEDKGWIEMMFKDYCKPAGWFRILNSFLQLCHELLFCLVNKVVFFETFGEKVPCDESSSCFAWEPLLNASVTLFKGKGCEGEVRKLYQQLT